MAMRVCVVTELGAPLAFHGQGWVCDHPITNHRTTCPTQNAKGSPTQKH